MFIPKLNENGGDAPVFSKRIIVGNGYNGSPPATRLGAVVFSAEVLADAKKHSVALVNSVEL